MSKKALETVKVNIDHIALTIENLQPAYKSEALLALEHAAASLSCSDNKRMTHSASFRSYSSAYHEAKTAPRPQLPMVYSSPHPATLGESWKGCKLNTQDERNKHQCETCAKSFPTNFKLRRHQRTGAGCDRILKQQIGSVKCHLCDYRTTSKDNLEDHLVKHSGKFQCPVCSHQFSRNYKLQNHIKNPDNCMKYMKHL